MTLKEKMKSIAKKTMKTIMKAITMSIVVAEVDLSHEKEKGSVHLSTNTNFMLFYFFSLDLKRIPKKCCDKCKKNDKNGKTCVCVVPANQRKVHIGSAGCKTCGCKGCTKEDMKEREELMRNGCCKKCMKAFSKNQKACLCQVPKAVRKQPLPPEGCNYCGCLGINLKFFKNQLFF